MKKLFTSMVIAAGIAGAGVGLSQAAEEGKDLAAE
jgi:hypothetical protein